MMSVSIRIGDWVEVLRTLDAGSVHTCVTSPPYWGLRDYGVDGQLGLEKTPQEYVEKIVEGFRAVRRVLRDDGTLWVNMGDSYIASATQDAGRTGELMTGGRKTQLEATKRPDKLPPGMKPKNLVGIPWRVAFALQADGWYLRSDIIWAKPNPMPESVTDRPTKSHEYLFLLSKQSKYYYDAEAIREETIPDPRDERWDTARTGKGFSDHKHDAERGRMQSKTQAQGWTRMSNPNGRNKRTVWTVPTAPYSQAHFATFPPDLIRPCILAGCPQGGTVLDPFGGSGTTGMVAEEEGRNSILIELNPEYAEMARKRTAQKGLFIGVSE